MDELTKLGMRVEKFSFPNYQSPTGRIIGGPYLGKSYIGDSWLASKYGENPYYTTVQDLQDKGINDEKR